MIEDLLAAVIADPADDAPRLVLADWLAQRGDPWGEIIVLSCELSPYLRDERRWDARATELSERYYALQQQRFPNSGIGKLDRGFCEVIRLDDGDLAQATGPMFSLVEEVSSWSATPEMLAALAAWPQLASVSRLDLRTEDDVNPREELLEVVSRAHGATDISLAGCALEPRDLRSILEQPRAVALRRLSISDSEFGSELGRMPWPWLEELGLGACGLVADDVEALLSCPALHDLKMLDLDFNQLDTDGADAIARCPFSRLERLEILGNELGAAGLAHLAASPSLAGVTTLGVGGEDDDLDDALPLLATAFPRLATLALSTMFPVSRLVAIARPYRKLSLELAHIWLDDLGALLTHPALRSLRNLTLELCDRTYLGEPSPVSGKPLGAAIASARLPELVSLDLDGCRLDEAGARALARAPHLPRELVLALNGAGELGAGRAALEARFARVYAR